MKGSPTRNFQTILRAAALRVLVYAALISIVTLSLVDFHALQTNPVANRPTADESPSSDPAWPHLRGPNYDARSAETELADAWPQTGPPVLWTKQIGAGYS